MSCAGETETVQTQLVGEHWMPVVLASLAVACHAGLPLRQAAMALRQMAPLVGRMQPVRLPCGATVLRDDYNAAIDGVKLRTLSPLMSMSPTTQR